MRYGLTLLTPPSGEPVTLAAAKVWCRVDADDRARDAELAALVADARDHCESATGLQLVSAAWRLSLDCWGDGGVIRLPRAPLQAVTSVTYTDTTGASQALSASAYQADTARGVIAPAYGYTWPAARDDLGAVRVDFVSGFGPATTIAAAVSAGAQTVTPGSMLGVYAGTALVVDEGEDRETVVVSAVGATTFTATFANSHAAGVAVAPAIPPRLLRGLLGRVRGRFDDNEAVVAAADKDIFASWRGEYL